MVWKGKSFHSDDAGEETAPPDALAVIAVGALIALLAAYTVCAGYAHDYMIATADQLFAPEPYISTVIDTPGKLSTPTEGY